MAIYLKDQSVYGFGLVDIKGKTVRNEVKEGQQIPANSYVKMNYGEMGGGFDDSDRIYKTGVIIGRATGNEKSEGGRLYVEIAARTIYRRNRSLFNSGGGEYLDMTILAWFDVGQTTADEYKGLNLIADQVERQQAEFANKSETTFEKANNLTGTKTKNVFTPLVTASSGNTTIVVVSISLTVAFLVYLFTRKPKNNGSSKR